MSDDIRLKISFKDHRKRKKANLLLGLQKSATDYILDLWISCAQNHPTGELTGMDEVDIALEAGWEGDARVFIEAMVAARVIDRNGDGVYRIHDWEEHQGWVYHSKERSELAKRAVNIRWERARKSVSKAEGIRPVCEQYTGSNTPSPSPSPSLKEKDPASPDSLVVQLDSKCKKLNALPKKKENFNPHQWVQWAANQRYHPQAVSSVLDILAANWQDIATPWTYASTIIRKESGNFYERDGTRDAKREKNEWSELIGKLKAVHGGSDVECK